MESHTGQKCLGTGQADVKPPPPQLISTSVQCGRVIHICSYEGRLGLSANSIVPHPPDTTLKEIFPVKTTAPHSGKSAGTAWRGQPVCSLLHADSGCWCSGCWSGGLRPSRSLASWKKK